MSQDLIRLFSEYGEVSFAAVVRDLKSGRSKGDAFVEMPREGQAAQAIQALHQRDVDGQAIQVQEIEYKAGDCNN